MNLEMKMYDLERFGRREGEEKKTREHVINMLKEGMSIELIARITDLEEDEIWDIKNKGLSALDEGEKREIVKGEL